MLDDYLLLNRSHNCNNNDWFSSLQYTFLENSDLVLQEFRNDTTNGVSTLIWINYTYSQDEDLVMNVKNKTTEKSVNGTVDNSTYGKTMEEYEYNSSDENRIVVLRFSYSDFNYTSESFDGVHQYWNVYDAFGNRIESSSYNHNSGYVSCNVYVWE